MNSEDSNVGTFLENLLEDAIDRKIIRMLLDDVGQEQILETLLDLVAGSADKND
ncbi:MAG: hypothetical protein QXU73_00695 [Thermoplasmata archaeon]